MSGSQAALMSSAKDLNLQVGHVKWHATGKYDLRGVRGEKVSRLGSQLQSWSCAQGNHCSSYCRSSANILSLT